MLWGFVRLGRNAAAASSGFRLVPLACGMDLDFLIGLRQGGVQRRQLICAWRCLLFQSYIIYLSRILKPQCNRNKARDGFHIEKKSICATPNIHGLHRIGSKAERSSNQQGFGQAEYPHQPSFFSTRHRIILQARVL